MKLEQILSLRYPLPEKSLDKLHRCMSEITLPKGFHILEINKVEKDIFFIKQGIVRAFTYVDGKEITFWIGKEGATIVSMKGYVNDEAGYETMELMEDSVLYVLKRKKLQELFLEDLHIANWGRRYAEMELLETEQRLISMLSSGTLATAAIGQHSLVSWHYADKFKQDKVTNEIALFTI